MTPMPTSTPSSPPPKSSPFLSKTAYAYVLAFGAHCCIAIAQFFIKRARAELPSFQTLYLIFLQVTVYIYFLMQHKGLSSVFKVPRLNRLTILRGFIGVTGSTGLLYSLGKLLLSEVIIIGNTSPLITAFLAILFLGEKCDAALGINAILSIVGVLFIAKPDFLFANNSSIEAPPREILGLVGAILSAIIVGVVPLILKYLGKFTHPITLVYFNGLITTMVAPIFMASEGVKAVNFYTFVMLLIGGIVWTLNLIFMSMSFMYADASRLGMVLYSQVIFAYALEILVDGIYPDSYTVIGTFCIMSGFLVMLSGKKSVSEKKINIFEKFHLKFKASRGDSPLFFKSISSYMANP